MDALTSIESDIYASIVDGLSNQEIADKRHVAIETVKGHVTNIYKKIGIKCRSKLIAEHYKKRLALPTGQITISLTHSELARIMAARAGNYSVL